MTYCLGMLLGDGLVMMADTRTNAGIDSISTYRKLHLFEGGNYDLVIASAGSLSTTQAALGHLREGITNSETGQIETLDSVATTFRAVTLIGQALHKAKQEVDTMTAGDKINVDASLLVGGRVGNEPLRLFLVYSAGNFIEGGSEMPYMQIGEKKYGKPIIDRSLKRNTDLHDAIKIGLISFDSTMRSNLAVGLPIDVVAMRPGDGHITFKHRIEADDPYMRDLGERWQAALKAAQASIPRPPFEF